MDSQIYKSAEYDPEWDSFLENQSSGHYTQSSLWGRLKGKFGWEVTRVLIKDNGAIVGGAQLLTRRLPVWGRIGYVSKGPIVIEDNPAILDQVFCDLEQIAKNQSILLLSIQPPCYQNLTEQSLKNHHYEPSCYYVIPPSTVVIDLSQTEDQILSQMKRTTRQNIRAAQSRGVIIREGSEADLESFCQLKRITESRSDFVHYNQCYYEEAWRQFAPHNQLKLWLASYGDELLAGLMAIYFGKWVVYAWAGSSGAQMDKRPNDLLFWHAMKWGKDNGYRFCDLGGISPIVAEHLRQNLDPPECKEKGIARYKLGFGPMHTFPSAYDNVFSIRPKWLVRKAISMAWNKNRKFTSKFVRGVSG
jgi:peptidoglycan pentaglycine glycine transferase (the first glycine)